MDAQNAAESSSTKQLASHKEADSGADTLRPKSTFATATNDPTPTTNNNKSPPVAKDARPVTISSNTLDDDVALDQNSDAETIVLPGKDGISPSKPRKVIKHEDKSDQEMNSIPRPRKPLSDARDVDRNGGHSDDGTSISLGGRKRRHTENEKQRAKNSSGALSSTPTSPLVHNRTSNDSSHRRHRSGDVQSESGSESSKSRSHKVSRKDKAKSAERLLAGKRRAVKTESDDEGGMRKARRPRISDTNIDASTGVRDRDYRTLSSGRPVDKQHIPRNRSVSPPSRTHRRSISTQLPSQSSNGLSNKKRRVPAPLQSTDYQSDDSSASGSPHPRSSKMKSIATPLTGESTISPARMPGHKKHVDNHGQTLLAKACAKGEYDIAQKRLAERPEDLNFADYAGNTPLQIASLNGHENIVQLLVDAGCNLDCRNSDKETPLLDAVENGHLGVVKLLLKAGVNPRKADAEGHEPLEKVPDDLDNAEEIRAALRDAKERGGELCRTSEDHQPQDLHDTLSSHGPDSPRDSPAAPISSLLAEKRRGGTVRSTKTSNHLLYMNLDDKTLRQAAARGDNETVTRVLQVKERCDDPEALVNAARGGHNLVVELLLALGGANPDPRPVPGLPVDHATPMLAAIGQENIEVIKLLLNANKFNPTRLYRGHTYYEIARRREGPNWKEEEHLLKDAYDQYKKEHKGPSKTKPSPSRREREQDTDSRRGNRHEPTSDVPRPKKRRPSISPSRGSEPKKKLNPAKTVRSPREKRRSLSFGTQDGQTSPKRGPGRPKREERESNTASSDREISPARSKNPVMPKLIEPEVAGSSDGEAIKPRRKLISGKDLKGQREKQRRESLASNVSGIERVEPKNDESSEKPREKHLNRTKALKRDESTDRLSAADVSGKRHRSSNSPSRRGSREKEDVGAPSKRRKLDPDAKEKRYLEPPSPENRHTKREMSRDSTQRQRNPDNDARGASKPTKTNRDRREWEKSSNSDKSITVASEEPDVEMRDVIHVSEEEEGEIPADSEREDVKKQRRKAQLESSARDEGRRKDAERELQERERKKQEEEAKQKEQEAERKRLEAEEQDRLEREELKRKEAAEKARLEEERRLREEEERKRLQEQERKQREEQERRQREEQERRRREEEERQRREDEERRRREEEERRRREEEERIRREKEIAAEEQARRVREEEERQKERERVERIARELELQRAHQAEQERIRVSKLPPLLRWLDSCVNPRHREIAELFAKAQGVRYDTIDPSTTGKPGGRDQWLLNTQVALLLGEKDISLSQYTTWQRVPVSSIAKRVIWRLEQDRYALTESKLYHLGEQLPDLYGGDPRTVGYKKLEQIRGDAANRFLETDMFFVKESDFLHAVPSIPHLYDVRIAICYRELPENESDLFRFSGPSKWKHDPDAASRGPFAPRNKYYINGRLVGEERPGKYRPSREPFPEQRVPRRRGGLVAVTPDEPDYARLCIEQNLAYLLTEQQKQSVLNGSHLTPKSMTSNEATEYGGENMSPSSLSSPQVHLVNGFRRNLESPGTLPNGISGDEHH